jgi:hypothetical protein
MSLRENTECRMTITLATLSQEEVLNEIPLLWAK